jgi:hypothetical protein
MSDPARDDPGAPIARDPAPAHGPGRPLAAPLIAAAAAALLIAVAVLSIEAYHDRTRTAEGDRKASEGRLVERRALEAAHAAQLSSYRWIDPQTRTRLAVPIERAMELVAGELRAAHPDQPASLVPAVAPAHDQATAPAVWGPPVGAAAADPTAGAAAADPSASPAAADPSAGTAAADPTAGTAAADPSAGAAAADPTAGAAATAAGGAAASAAAADAGPTTEGGAR